MGCCLFIKSPKKHPNGKIYLIGGNVIRGSKSNKVWEGTIHPEMEFTFKEISSMREERIGHFSIVVKKLSKKEIYILI